MRLRLVWMLPAMVALASPSNGEIHGYRSIEGLLDLADVAAAGLLIQVRQAPGSTSGSLTLTAPTYFLGSGPDFALVVQYDDVWEGGVVGLLGSRVLVFASTDSEGKQHLVSPEYGGTVFLKDTLLWAKSASPPEVLGPEAGDSAMARLIKELASICVSAPDTMSAAWLTGLGRTPAYQADVVEAFQAVIAWPTASAASVRGATHGLVALGTAAGLAVVDAGLQRGSPVDDRLLESLENAYASTDPEGVETLIRRLPPDQEPRVRAAAAGALARIHTAAAVLALGPLLEEADFQLRWRAIGGLSMFANNIPIGGMGAAPGPWPFSSEETFLHSIYDEEGTAKDEIRYLGFWRRWWSEYREAVAEAAARGCAAADCAALGGR